MHFTEKVIYVATQYFIAYGGHVGRHIGLALLKYPFKHVYTMIYFHF